jgi:hypothetical protein
LAWAEGNGGAAVHAERGNVRDTASTSVFGTIFVVPGARTI